MLFLCTTDKDTVMLRTHGDLWMLKLLVFYLLRLEACSNGVVHIPKSSGNSLKWMTLKWSKLI